MTTFGPSVTQHTSWRPPVVLVSRSTCWRLVAAQLFHNLFVFQMNQVAMCKPEARATTVDYKRQ